MRRFLLFVMSLLIFLPLSAQEPLTFSKIIQAPGKDANSIYQNVKLWVASSFGEAKAVIQIDDASQKMITLAVTSNYSKDGLSYLAYTGWIKYNIMIQCRDERFQVKIMNIIHQNKPGNAEWCNLGLILNSDKQFTSGANKNSHNKVCADIKEKISSESDVIFKSIEDFVLKTTTKDEDNW